MDGLKEAKYKVVENFLSKDELLICKKYLISKQRESKEFTKDNVNLDTGIYLDELLNVFLEIKQPLMEKILNLELIKTFSIFRRGLAHDVLKIVVEIGKIAITAFKTDLGYLLVGFRQ